MTTRCRGLVAVIALVLATFVLTSTNSGATPAFSFTRFAGTDRYDTARRVAATFGTSDLVVITSGTGYADALTGSYAAGLAGVPILLTGRDRIPAPTLTALTDLKATKVLIVGGTVVVGPAVETALKARRLVVTRIAGATRYETAQLVAASGGASAVGRSGLLNQPTAIVASGESFPDALSAGPMAYAGHFPIILTTAAGLSPQASAALTELGIRNVLLVGGSAAVSTAAEVAIVAKGIVVTRLAGNDRTETATRVADYEIANLGFVNTHVDLSRGEDFADALTGTAHSGTAKAPALLTSNVTSLGVPTRTWLAAHASTLTSGHINGGTSAVSAAVESEATVAAKTGTTTTTGVLPTLPGGGTIPTTLPVPTTLPPPPGLTPCTPPQIGPGQPFCFNPLL